MRRFLIGLLLAVLMGCGEDMHHRMEKLDMAMVLVDIWDDGNGTAYISDRDTLGRLQTWQKKYPEKRIVALAALSGQNGVYGLMIKYEVDVETPTCLCECEDDHDGPWYP